MTRQELRTYFERRARCLSYSLAAKTWHDEGLTRAPRPSASTLCRITQARSILSIPPARDADLIGEQLSAAGVEQFQAGERISTQCPPCARNRSTISPGRSFD
jgi:hypothetical protein